MLTETIHAGAFIVSEGRGWFSRDAMTVALSQTLLAGTIVGAVGLLAAMTVTAAPDAGNTSGSGAITMDATAPVAAGAKNGTYRAVCIEPVSAGGIFAVFDPDGVEIGNVAVGATFNNQVKFVIADAADFVAGDAFSIVVGRESGKDEQIKAFDPAAVDGAQNIVGIVVYPVTTDGTNTAPVAVLRRHAEVRGSDLTWPTGISAANLAAGIEALRKLGIIVR